MVDGEEDLGMVCSLADAENFHLGRFASLRRRLRRVGHQSRSIELTPRDVPASLQQLGRLEQFNHRLPDESSVLPLPQEHEFIE
ncbi:hypothetical protein GQ602_000786 [Ophiocordyceps camponoti-floridani]|uniref:Uncharacterized protein n=1 Tax=Ophiocordyceps camponoti-floridani TaxID=2030778 RepID=A0A8H4QCU3_9HYPO|nr:hypothetical protein GQ602_000786 [Ophiocordyceps camponoti-floridani]